MESKVETVEIASEPKIQSRFGFQPGRKAPSSTTIKICAGVTVLSIATLLLMNSPDPIITNDSGVKSPEISDVSTMPTTEISTYSATEESNRLKAIQPRISSGT